jgi:hypothetical protein
MLEGLVADTFWIREKSGILVKKVGVFRHIFKLSYIVIYAAC